MLQTSFTKPQRRWLFIMGFAKFEPRRIGSCVVWLFLLMLCYAWSSPSTVFADSAITIDSHSDGAELPVGVVRLSGTYAKAYDLKLILNGAKQADAVMDDPDGDDSGTWYYDLDTSQYDGNLEIAVRGSDAVTRYGVWSAFVTLHVNNPDANVPQVSIANPGDGTTVSGTQTVQISAAGRNPIASVQVRVNGGAWQDAVRQGEYYEWSWDTVGIGDKTCSIEGRATDTRGNIGRSMTTYAKVGAGTNEPVTLYKQDRAMWIWEPAAYNLLLNPGSRTVLDAFARDTSTFGSDPITTFYLAVGSFGGMDILEDDPGKLREFMTWAHGRGYKVQATIAGGTSPPFLGAYERYHTSAVRAIEQIINYNIASASNERFDGVNVDIEPYILPDFKTNVPSLQIQHLDGLFKMIQRRDTAGINLPFGPAIPKWYDSLPQAQNIEWRGATKWLSEQIQDISDYIAMMDYRDSADGSAGITQGALGELAYADSIGKPNSVVIGVENARYREQRRPRGDHVSGRGPDAYGSRAGQSICSRERKRRFCRHCDASLRFHTSVAVLLGAGECHVESACRQYSPFGTGHLDRFGVGLSAGGSPLRPRFR